jgi:hypothetical protein
MTSPTGAHYFFKAFNVFISYVFLESGSGFFCGILVFSQLTPSVASMSNTMDVRSRFSAPALATMPKCIDTAEFRFSDNMYLDIVRKSELLLTPGRKFRCNKREPEYYDKGCVK